MAVPAVLVAAKAARAAPMAPTVVAAAAAQDREPPPGSSENRTESYTQAAAVAAAMTGLPTQAVSAMELLAAKAAAEPEAHGETARQDPQTPAVVAAPVAVMEPASTQVRMFTAQAEKADPASWSSATTGRTEYGKEYGASGTGSGHQPVVV